MSDNTPDIEKLRKLYYKKLLGTATLDELWQQVKKKKLGFKLKEVKAFLKRHELHGRMTIDHSTTRCDCTASEREP